MYRRNFNRFNGNRFQSQHRIKSFDPTNVINTPQARFDNEEYTISHEFFDFSKNLGIYCALCIGGANIRSQISDLSRNPNFVIGTPGRIQDLLHAHTLNLSVFATVVLDETDRMVDIGFIKDVKYIISLRVSNPKQKVEKLHELIKRGFKADAIHD